MKTELVYSILLHIGVILATVIASPFEMKSVINDDSIIRVRLTQAPDIQPIKPVKLEPVAVPEAVSEDIPDIPVSDPTTMKAAKIKAKEKPKQKKKPKKKTPKKRQSKNTGNNSTPEKNTKDTEIDAGNASGSPFAGATVDNADFDYPYWFTQTFNKISSNYRNTVSYDGRLICTIYFQVIRSGRVIGIRIEKSSGVDEFDQVCLDAVKRSAPFPPLPNSFRDEIIGLTLPITN